MAGRVWIITQLALTVFVFDGMMSSPWPDLIPGPTTPSELTINLNKVSLKTGLLSETPWIDYVTTTTPVDVIASSTGIPSPATDTTASSFGTGVVPAAEYKQVKIVLDGMAIYTGTDPCDGHAANEESIELPGMVASSEDGLNKVTLKYQEPHPVTGVPAGSVGIEAFTVSGPFEFRLIFPASNSVICAANVAPLETITGTLDGPNGLALDPDPTYPSDPTKGRILVTNGGLSESVTAYDRNGTSSVVRASISGTNTGLSNPVGIYVDGAPHYEIGVANTGNNSVTIYDNSPGAILGNVAPLHVITGNNTKLSGPGGIAIFPDSGDSTIAVANGGNNSVTLYSRNALLGCVNCNNDPVYPALHGSLTGLNAPCGLYVDTFNQEIGVANNGNSSVTVYRLDDIASSFDGNVPPVRTIQGPDTGLSVPCGLFVDTLHDEIGVTNNGTNTITYYQRTDQGDAAPTRTLRGNATGLNGPVGIYLDPVTDQIVVANRHNDRTDDTVTTYNRDEPGVQLKGPPALHISAEQQSLLTQYFYAGQLDKQTGMAVVAPMQGYDCDGDGIPDFASGDPVICFDGYRFDWKITDDRVRQLGDATTLGMIPPNNAAFRLTDGSVLSVLSPGCPVLTPFIILELFTNCPPIPMISAPLPPPSGDYTIPAVIFQETKLTNKIRYTTTSLLSSQFPQLIPTVNLNADNDNTITNKTISNIVWEYAGEPPDPNDSTGKPLIGSQGIQINLTRDIGDVSPCYTQVSGNAQTLVYSSGSLTPDIRDSSDIKNDTSSPTINNNGCPIYLSDVDTITFTVTDALGNNFIFTWK